MKKMKRIVLKNLLIIIFLFSNKIFSQAISNQSVITEEYVPKVIIEGKWGTNAGEFGRNFLGMGTKDYTPSSLAVNSKGEIYILDLVNNRIQKFDKEGRYLKSIKVESFKGWAEYETVGVPVDPNNPEGEIIDNVVKYIHPTEVLGINIAIDSEDNLYYYCHKNLMKTNESGESIRNPDARGEVWLFKNDKLVRKWETNLMERFEPSPDYEIEKQKLDRCKIEKSDKNSYIIIKPNGEKIQIKVEANVDLSDKGKLLKDDKIEIYDRKNKKFRTYDKNGKLEKISGIIPFGGVSDKENNFYKIESYTSVIRIEKWRLKRK